MTTYDSTTVLGFGNADVETGNGQLGKAIFLSLTADVNSNTLPAYYDTYVMSAGDPYNFRLPTAIRGYKVYLLNVSSGSANITILDDVGLNTVFTLRQSRSIRLILTGIGPQVWSVLNSQQTLNDAYKAGQTGIISWDNTRRAVKVSDAVTPSLSDALLAATYANGINEDSTFEAGRNYMNFLCPNGTAGVVAKTGANIAITAAMPSGSLRSIVKGASPTGAITDSLVFGPVTINNSTGASVVLAPNSTLTLPSNVSANDVIIAPNTTVLQNGASLAQARRSVLIGANNSYSVDDAVGALFVGSGNTITAPVVQFPNSNIIGSSNTLNVNGGDQTRLVLMGSNNSFTGTVTTANAILVGSANTSNGIAGNYVVVGSSNTFTTSNPANTGISPHIFSSLTTFTDAIGDNAPTGFSYQSTLASVGSDNIIGVSGSSISPKAVNMDRLCVVGKNITYNVNNSAHIAYGTNLVSTTPLTTALGPTMLIGDNLATGDGNTYPGSSNIAFGFGLSCLGSGIMAEKVAPTVSQIIINGGASTINPRNYKVTFASESRFSSNQQGDAGGTLNLDASTSPATSSDFDSIYEHTALRRPVAIAGGATGSITLTGNLASNLVMCLEYWAMARDTVLNTSAVYHGITRVSRIGVGVTLIDPPITDNFVGIAAAPTLTLTLSGLSEPTLTVANNAVGANNIRVSAKVRFSTLS